MRAGPAMTRGRSTRLGERGVSERLKHFRDNAGLGGLLRAALIALVVVAAGGGGIYFGRFDLAIGAVYGLGVPYFFRRVLVEYVEVAAKWMRWWGYSIVGGTMVIGWLNDQEPRLLESPLAAVMLAYVGAYIATYFWVLSDRGVVQLD